MSPLRQDDTGDERAPARAGPARVELYESAWRRPLAPARARLLERAALTRGARVLDVACGSGLVTFAAADAVGAGGMVTAIDLSEEMVAKTRARAEVWRMGHVRAERMDAEALALPDGSLDCVLCAFGLMYVPDARPAVAEMVRVTAEGGRVAAAVWGRRARCGWADIFPIVDARVRSEVCPLYFALGTADRLAQLFAEAGLTDVVTDRIETRLAWASPGEACDAAFAGGPVAPAYARFDAATRAAVREAYLASIEEWREPRREPGSATGPEERREESREEEGYAVPGEFVIVSGRKPWSAGAPS